MDYYSDFNGDGRSLVHLINLLLGENVIGAEVGIFKGVTFCTLLQNCPNIKTLYGIDSWQPYVDKANEQYPQFVMDEKEIEYVKLTAIHNIKYSGFKEKAIIINKKADDALEHFEDGSLDFVFLDAYLDKDSAINDINKWYPKVRNGGLFSGHDYQTSQAVRESLVEFRSKNNIKTSMSVFDDTWVWIK